MSFSEYPPFYSIIRTTNGIKGSLLAILVYYCHSSVKEEGKVTNVILERKKRCKKFQFHHDKHELVRVKRVNVLNEIFIHAIILFWEKHKRHSHTSTMILTNQYRYIGRKS